jgi:hypothetical protein
MNIGRAYELRLTLSDIELERLEQGLKDEAERYRFIIQNSPPDRLAIEKPFLAKMEARLDDVRRLRAERARN